MRSILATVPLVLATALLATSADAKDDKHKGHKKHHEHHDDDYDEGYYVGYRDGYYQGAVTIQEYAIIRDYVGRYGAAPFAPPYGLPPGPVTRPLPPGLAHRLPVRPGYEWRVVDRDVVLVALATGVIVGVLAGAF